MINKLLTFSLAIMVGVVFGLAINHQAAASAAQDVYAACDSARQEINGASEQRCGDLQDKYNIEFLCDANNNLPATHCWTEAK